LQFILFRDQYTAFFVVIVRAFFDRITSVHWAWQSDILMMVNSSHKPILSRLATNDCAPLFSAVTRRLFAEALIAT